MATQIKLTDALTSANNKQEKKKQPRSYPNKKLAAILLILFGGAALTPGIVAAKGAQKGAQNESYRVVCPLPKVLINKATPHGKIKSLCVNSKAAEQLLRFENVNKPPLSPSLGTTTATSLATDLMTAAVKGAGSKAAGAAMGWTLGALGLTSGEAKTDTILQGISDELSVIEETLTEMSSEIHDMDAAIRIQSCDSFIEITNLARSTIDTLAGDYQDFVVEANNGTLPPLTITDPNSSTYCSQRGSESCVEDWSTAVLNETTGIKNAVLQIHNSMVALSSSDGIIASCLDPVILPLPVVGEDDSNYYGSIANLMNAFYNYQARGLLLLVEAYNFNAWMAAGEPAGNPAEYNTATSDICLIKDSTVQLMCGKTEASVKLVHDNLVQQFTKAGVGYSDDDARIHYRGNSNALLFARSLEDFTAEAHLQGFESCSSPLSSSAPCGITAGNFETSNKKFGITYAHQFNWRPAYAGELQALYQTNVNRTPASYLRDAGFENPEDKLIIHSNYFQFDMNWNQRGVNTLVFTDLDLYPTFVPQPVNSIPKMQNFWMYGKNLQGYAIGVENPNIPTLNRRNNFYKFATRTFPQNDVAYLYSVSPGWSTDFPEAKQAQQYRWPVMTVQSDIVCTKGRANTNVAGAFMRCGPDLDVWLEQNIPGLPINNQPISYRYIGSQPQQTTNNEAWWDVGAQLVDQVQPLQNASINDDRWVGIQSYQIGMNIGPLPSVEFDLGGKTYLSLISINYASWITTIGPSRVEIFLSTDGGATYSSTPDVVYKGFVINNAQPGITNFTDIIPINVKDVTNVRMDFYADATTASPAVLLGEIKFID